MEGPFEPCCLVHNVEEDDSHNRLVGSQANSLNEQISQLPGIWLLGRGHNVLSPGRIQPFESRLTSKPVFLSW